MPTEFDDWFVREVLVHERALALFLQRSWPHRDEWHDLRQEVYARVYEAAARARPDTPKAFLFATAQIAPRRNMPKTDTMPPTPRSKVAAGCHAPMT